MGLVGRYIDRLGDDGRDRLLEAQEWCLAELVGPAGARCLIGHAEDWRPMAVEGAWWRRWLDAEAAGGAAVPPEGELDALCRPELFAFRGARPADLPAYRARLERLGPGSEASIGSRFDRLCVRLGTRRAVRLVKARAARGPAPRPQRSSAVGPYIGGSGTSRRRRYTLS